MQPAFPVRRDALNLAERLIMGNPSRVLSLDGPLFKWIHSRTIGWLQSGWTTFPHLVHPTQWVAGVKQSITKWGFWSCLGDHLTDGIRTLFKDQITLSLDAFNSCHEEDWVEGVECRKDLETWKELAATQKALRVVKVLEKGGLHAAGGCFTLICNSCLWAKCYGLSFFAKSVWSLI